MAPMLEDEIMHDAEKMNSKVAGIARTGKQIYDFIEQLKRAKNAAPENLDNGLPFSFSGQITDLSYFNNNEILPKEVIDSNKENNARIRNDNGIINHSNRDFNNRLYRNYRIIAVTMAGT